MPTIHPTAIIGRECELAEDVEVGPFCVLNGRVRLGAGVRLIGNVYLDGVVTIGERTQVYPFACIGFPGQDVKFKRGDKTAGVVIGADGILREHATVHAATNDHTPTSIGDRVFMMACSHVGHDGRIGTGVTMVNAAAVGGHGQVGDGAILGGGALIHQFSRVGRQAFLSGGSAISTDVPPFCIASGRNMLAGINLVGLRRGGMPRDQITLVRAAYRAALRAPLTRTEMLDRLQELGRDCPPVAEMARFVAEAKRVCPSMTRSGGRRVAHDEEAAVE